MRSGTASVPTARSSAKQVRLQGNAYTVIGVLPPDFSFVRSDAIGGSKRIDAFVAFENDLDTARPDNGNVSALMRARHGASPQAVAAAVAEAGRTVDKRDFNSKGLSLYPLAIKT